MHRLAQVLGKLKKSAVEHKLTTALIVVALLVGGFVAHKHFNQHSQVSPYAGARLVSQRTANRAVSSGQASRMIVAGSAVYLRLPHHRLDTVSFPDISSKPYDAFLALARKHGLTIAIDHSQSRFSSGGSSDSGKVLGIDPSLFGILIPILILLVLVYFIWQQRGAGRAVTIASQETNVDFKDVAGCGEVVQELEDIREFLKNPHKYAALGAKVPKGVLLHGPPGTGKTLVAKAIATEANVDFFAVSGSDFVEMYVGLGAKRVRQLFAKAKKSAPAIVFIDELDAVGRARSSAGDGGSREADQTLNQLLVEMDGFEVKDNPVIVIGATNRLDHLDPALLRPGRFDRKIAVDPPDKKGRLAILNIHAIGKALGPDVDLESLAAKSQGMSGAELASVLNEAALVAARGGAKAVAQRHIEDGFVRVIAGAKKQNRAMTERERVTVAYHEAGHALAAELLDSPTKVEQISIEPRGNSLGHMIFSNEEEIALESKSQLESRIVVALAGRAAEELTVKDITAGAQDDLDKSTRIAKAMIAKLGMGQTLGLYVIDDSKEMPTEVREEIKQFLADRYGEAKALLAEHRDLLERVTQALLAEETMSRKRFLELIANEPAAALVAEAPPLASIWRLDPAPAEPSLLGAALADAMVEARPIPEPKAGQSLAEAAGLRLAPSARLEPDTD